MYVTTTGLVLRETDYRESSRILTVLTASEGKITVSAKGARRKGSKTAAATQLLALSEMTLVNNRGRWTLSEARCIEEFAGLRDDIALLALGAYIAEVTEAVANEGEPGGELMSLALNALFAVGEQKRPPELIRAAFEMRVAAMSGFVPDLSACPVCGREDPVDPVLDVTGGTVHCAKCSHGDIYMQKPLCRDSLEAMRHILSAPPKRVFAFRLEGSAMSRLSRAAEEYLRTHLETEFRGLSYYKSVRNIDDIR